MELGIPVTLVGIVIIVVGWATYTSGFNKNLGLVGVVIGVIVAIIGIVLWLMKGKAPAPAAPATPQQPKT